VKIRQQNIDRLEAVSGCDEDGCFAGERADLAVDCRALKDPQRCGADALNQVRARGGRCSRHVAPFAMHFVVAGVVGFDR
jgi:hypothetical protein